jgi:phosphonatase-like hydrolase
METQLVVLDMAGTTVRDDDAVHNCLQEALAAGNCAATRDEINQVMGLPKPLAIEQLLTRLSPTGPTRERVEAIHEDFLRRMIHYYETDPRVEPMPGAAATLRSLKTSGILIALDTGFSRPIVNTILKRLGWQDGFLDATVASDEVARGRPHPDLILKAMELTRVKEPGCVAKVGDTPADLLEGTAAGCGLVVGVTNGSHRKEELQAYPHTHLLRDLSELPELILG